MSCWLHPPRKPRRTWTPYITPALAAALLVALVIHVAEDAMTQANTDTLNYHALQCAERGC